MNREEKIHAGWTNRHILERVNYEEKKAVSFQFTNMIFLIFCQFYHFYHFFTTLVPILPHGQLDFAGKYYQDTRSKKYYWNMTDQIKSFIIFVVLR